MPATIANLDSVLASIINSVLGLVGIAFIVQLIISGYHYLGAGSNKEALVKAQNSFLFSFVGLIIALAAWVIINIAGTFLGINVRTFTICINSNGCI
jgi:hypothetical protein